MEPVVASYLLLSPAEVWLKKADRKTVLITGQIITIQGSALFLGETEIVGDAAMIKRRSLRIMHIRLGSKSQP